MSSVFRIPVEVATGIASTSARTAVRTWLQLVPPNPTPGLDPDLRRVSRLFDLALASPERLPVQLARLGYRVDSLMWQRRSPEGVTTRDEQLALPADPSGPARKVKVRTYTPPHTTHGGLVYLHGGGWSIGSVETHDAVCRRLAAGAGAHVHSVEYRLAPEDPYPAGITDAMQAWRQLHARWLAHGGDPARFGIGGDSAGGHMAATAAAEAVEPTLGVEVPMPGFAWMVYPATRIRLHDDRVEQLLPSGGIMNGPTVARFAEWHLGDRDPAAPALNPLDRSDEVLRQHPPTWLQTVGFDPLRAEGEAYAKRLASLGVDVDHHHAETMAHGYISMTGISPAAAAAFDAGVAALRRFVDWGE